MLSSKSLFLCTQAMSSNSSSLPAVTGSPSSSSNSIKTSSTESLLLFALCLCSAMLAYIHTVFVDLFVHNSCLFTIAKVLTFEVLSLVTAARTLAHAGQLHKRLRLLLRKLHSKRRGQRSLICSHTLLLAAVQVALADRSRSLRHQRFSSQGK